MSVPTTIQSKTKMPAIFAQTAGGDEQDEFTANVQSGFGVVSFRGKVWRIRKGGKEEKYLDLEGEAVQTIEVVMVRSNPQPSKVFYKGEYETGSSEAPDCWSSNSIAPDLDVPDPVSKTCAACANNVWGSKLTPSGAKSRACADVRRVAVVFISDLIEKGPDATAFLLRVPPATLNPLKDYAQHIQSRGVYVYSMVTKIGFDTETAHAKLTFRPVRVVTDEEAENIVAIRTDDSTKRILAESSEFVAAGTPGDGATEDAPAGPSKPPAAASKARKLQPVEDEEEEEEEETAPPPPPVVRKKKKKVAAPPPPAEDEDEDEEEEEAATPPPAVRKAATEKVNYDSVLDAVLGKKKV